MRLKLGLEVHAQLQALHKLFSRGPTGSFALPNSKVSYFDAALPGTQPRLSLSCFHLALRAGLALNSDIQPQFSFDRKHYMYPDQPSGYQITQYREPFARGGYLDLLPRDFSPAAKSPSQTGYSAVRIGIEQIQMEQDTGKTTYSDGMTLVDLNRANTGLIELVTTPSFTAAEQAVAFVRKLQLLLRRLGVCSGEMEAGAMRVDVNVSVMDSQGANLGERCEIKNLFSPSAVRHAIRAEFDRQCCELKAGNAIERETRGWNGKTTWKLRSKENALDYRYMPDPDLPTYRLPQLVVDKVRAKLPELPDTTLDRLTSAPFGLSIVDARTLVELDGGAEFCVAATTEFMARGGQNAKMVGTYLVHRWLGQCAGLPSNLIQFVDILLAIDSGKVSTTTGRLLIKHAAQGFTGSIDSIINELELSPEPASDSGELENACSEVINANPSVIAKIRGGKRSSIGFLLGQVMKETQGTLDPKRVKQKLERLVAVESNN